MSDNKIVIEINKSLKTIDKKLKLQEKCIMTFINKEKKDSDKLTIAHLKILINEYQVLENEQNIVTKYFDLLPFTGEKHNVK